LNGHSTFSGILVGEQAEPAKVEAAPVAAVETTPPA
jgi:hypothetical protein